MPGRIYTVSFTSVAATLAQDLFEINAASTKVVELLEIHLSQATELGDAMEEQLTIALKSGFGTSGSGGSAPTAVPMQLGDAAYAGTVETNNTTKASTGTQVTHAVWNWNVRTPFDVIFTPETTKILAPSGRMVVELVNAPGDSITISGYVVIREIG